MKRSAALAALALLVALPTGSDAAPKRKQRTETLSYTLPTGVSIAGSGVTSCGDPVRACLSISLGKDEKYIKFSAADASGQKVGVQFFAGDTNAEYTAGNVQFVCGEGKGTYKKPGPVSFRIAIDNNCPAIPTQGKLTVIISNLP